MKLFNKYFSPVPSYFVSDPNIFSVACSRTASAYVLPIMLETKFNTHRKQRAKFQTWPPLTASVWKLKQPTSYEWTGGNFNRHLRGFRDENPPYSLLKSAKSESVRWEVCYRMNKKCRNKRYIGYQNSEKRGWQNFFQVKSTLDPPVPLPLSCKTEIGYRSVVIQIEFSCHP
jgi:hypothetical protein